MVWKNQESLELCLDGFWGNGHLKMQKIYANKFCLHFLAAIVDLQIGLED